MTRRVVPGAGALARHPTTRAHGTISPQQLIKAALSLGSIYGLIAIGYTMVYGIVGMINFAHGDIFMIGGLHRADQLPDPGFARPHHGPRDPVHRAIGLDGGHCTLWLDREAHRLPAAAALVPTCPDAVGDRMSFVLSNFFAGVAGRAGQGGATDHHRRVHRCFEQKRFRGAAVQCADHRRHQSHRVAGDLHAGWWRATRLAATCGPANRTRPWRRCSGRTSSRTSR